MPLDGAMVATPPAGTTAVPNTVVASAPYNALKDDMYNIINTKVQPVTGGGTGAATAVGGFDGLNVQGTDIATAATLNLDTATGPHPDLTGSVTVTAVTLSAGKQRITRSVSDFLITTSATLIGGGASSVQIKAGDLIIWEGFSGGIVRFWITRASGLPVTMTPPRGYIFGLITSNDATDPGNDIGIAAGEAASSDAVPVLIKLPSLLTKRLDAAWAVGSGNGGLDTGAIANALYYVFLIGRLDTGVVDAIFSLSASAPVLPANYTVSRRIGSFYRAAGAIRLFKQTGDMFTFKGSVEDVPAGSVGAARSLFTVTAPPNTTAVMRISVFNAVTNALLAVLETYEQDVSITGSNVTPGATFATEVSNVNSSQQVSMVVDASSQIAARGDQSGFTFRIVTRGYVDARGRLA